MEVTSADGRARAGHRAAATTGISMSTPTANGAERALPRRHRRERHGADDRATPSGAASTLDALDFNRPVRDGERHRLLRARHGSTAWRSAPSGSSDVPVGVMPDGALDTSLLGMSTIDRFASWRIEGDRMVLVP